MSLLLTFGPNIDPHKRDQKVIKAIVYDRWQDVLLLWLWIIKGKDEMWATWAKREHACVTTNQLFRLGIFPFKSMQKWKKWRKEKAKNVQPQCAFHVLQKFTVHQGKIHFYCIPIWLLHWLLLQFLSWMSLHCGALDRYKLLGCFMNRRIRWTFPTSEEATIQLNIC